VVCRHTPRETTQRTTTAVTEWYPRKKVQPEGRKIKEKTEAF